MAVIQFAPLQGYTDQVYREAHARVFGGVETYYTPFVRVEKGEVRKKDLRDIRERSTPCAHVVPQLIASCPEEFRLIMSEISTAGYREVDINLGCPFPKQVRLHRGSGLLPYRDEAENLLRTLTEFPDFTFSVKMRLGWEQVDEAFDLLPFLNTLPLRQITLHPRLGKQQYKGEVNVDAFSRFYEACQVPLCYNGDLTTIEAIRSIETRFPKLAGIMLGRGLLASPWLAEEYQAGESLPETERFHRAQEFHTLLLESYADRLEGGEHQVLDKMKTVWDYLLPDADKKLRKKILKSATLTSYQSAVNALLNQ